MDDKTTDDLSNAYSLVVKNVAENFPSDTPFGR